MSVGIVLVSHSALIAHGLVDLARQMAPTVAIVPAGGSGDGTRDDAGIGTSFDVVSAALAEAEGGDGVVVLADLGSAYLTAETAVDLLDEDAAARVLVVRAPLVEGAVAAAVAAETGGSLEDVAAAAASAAGADAAEDADAGLAPDPRADESEPGPAGASGSVRGEATLVNRDGLHARPAADFVTRASAYSAAVTVNGQNAASLLGVMALGLTRGAHVVIEATGEDAEEAVTALVELIESGFGEV
ncbi:dihydroxyacetone kinase phosphoryl donor subunit DhaM [Clavibacter michiganensis]|uniref:dihydroxyacetone kinase phosphoryl donor subunit DhaM n=1 Tax=Clavibacter michiganensis TaxID=28447 RepID=UPI000A3CE7E2|nr:dihydroxyacetone kinase phosphoryl donor subunit DhaM [Clavibacter michiganensis]MDO4099466.1 dihydroxyacetone kinase phosphoryl donor subunit DhaM [Clavibacter michiganensis]MDO4127200.1 dihydroxyacetone kinase phosphoryl donor subunit DhaM [Clavibacter michiganensis]NIY60722.1 HPr family phosphocarrier protein [Clavibacter michiganensis subsp. michiganensis]OUE26672.1 PTS-dependent dihydroxyacetone kinase, phosphotransferase subunit DhaM [Clavibacter michiganensis subsp. michiganensis]QXP